MDTLIQLLKKALAESFTLYLKAHNYHWNVEGPNFSEYHTFFGDIYLEIHASIDLTAEKIRMLGSYAPGSFSRFSEMSEIKDELAVPNAQTMMNNLYHDNQTLINTLNLTLKFAIRDDKQALADYLTTRLDAHEKHAWMLRSYLNQ